GIGRPVLMLSRHPKESVDHKRICQRLIQRWSAKIFDKGDKPAEAQPHVQAAREQAVRPAGGPHSATGGGKTLSSLLSQGQGPKANSPSTAGTFFSVI